MRRWLVLLVCVQAMACRSFSEWVSLLGFTEIRAPSTLYAPGSILLVENKEPYEAQVLCDVNEVLGVGYKPTVSRTVTIGTTKKRSRSITFNVDAATLAGGNVDVHAIKSVKVQMKDPRILMVTPSDVWARRKNLSQNCVQSLSMLNAFDKDSKKRITMVGSVLAADASYSVEWDDNAGLDVHAKVAQLESLAADLKLEASRVGSRTLSAQGVYWGIKDNRFLAYLVDPKNQPRVAEDARLMAPEQAVDIMRPISQAPGTPALKEADAKEAAAATADEDEPAIDPADPSFRDQVASMIPYDPGAATQMSVQDVDDVADAAKIALDEAAPVSTPAGNDDDETITPREAPPGQGQSAPDHDGSEISNDAPAPSAPTDEPAAPARPRSPRSRRTNG